MNTLKVHKCLALRTVFVTSLSPFLCAVDSDLPAVRRAYWCQKREKLQFSPSFGILSRVQQTARYALKPAGERQGEHAALSASELGW